MWEVFNQQSVYLIDKEAGYLLFFEWDLIVCVFYKMCLLHLNYEYYQHKIFNDSINYNFPVCRVCSDILFFLFQLAICAFYLSSLSISLKKVLILFSDSFKELDFALIGCFLYYFLLLLLIYSFVLCMTGN